MKKRDIILAIGHELESAKKKFPEWPTDKIHAAAIVAEECGEGAGEDQCAGEELYITTDFRPQKGQAHALAVLLLYAAWAWVAGVVADVLDR